MTAPTDERGGLPSASALARIALCPGSYAAEAAAPDTGKPSADADSGTRIHAALANEKPDIPLTEEEQRIVVACDALLGEVAGATYGVLSDADTLVREERMWFTTPDKQRLFSGKPDVVAIYGQRALIVDYKTGRGAVTPAHSNLQLRALVALVSQHYPIREATVVIIQPLADVQVSSASYNDDDIAEARREVCDIITAAKQDRAPRVPSTEACRYCRAQAICPEARDLALQTPVPVVDYITAPELAAALTNDKLALFLERASFAEKVIEACRDEAKRRIEAGQQVDGWKLKPGTAREVITDPQRVYDRFTFHGGTADGFMACVSITKGKLKDALKAATGRKGKELEAALDSLLAGCTETKQNTPSLVKQ